MGLFGVGYQEISIESFGYPQQNKIELQWRRTLVQYNFIELMKIATWNLERPTQASNKNVAIIDALNQVDADILILTETNDSISLSDNYHYASTQTPTNIPKKAKYNTGEKRVTIHSKYPIIKYIETYDGETSICVELSTPNGNLIVYGTIIGIVGNRAENFLQNLSHQLRDFERIASMGNICIAGDFNISFGDNYYFTKDGRTKLDNAFNKLKLLNLTANITNNIDHIVVSKTIIENKNWAVDTWNKERRKEQKLSDHFGLSVTIS
jgi:endonuclease/exonuclease/phosphatase family metal-dependent hydrolase